jgi:exonuclease VII small subunit
MNNDSPKWLNSFEIILLSITVILSGLVSILDFLGVLDSMSWLAGRIPTLTLLVIGLMAGYLIIERKSHLEKMNRDLGNSIENLSHELRKSTESTIASLNGVEIKLFDSGTELLQYVNQRLKQAQNQIDDLSWSPIIGLKSDLNTSRKAYQEYEEHITKASSKIAYREVMVFNHPARIENLQRRIAENAPGYSCSYYETPIVPLLQFMIIDRQEVIVLSDQFQTKFALRHPHIVKLFQEYYEEIWRNSTPIKIKTEIKSDVVSKILNTDWGFALRK